MDEKNGGTPSWTSRHHQSHKPFCLRLAQVPFGSHSALNLQPHTCDACELARIVLFQLCQGDRSGRGELPAPKRPGTATAAPEEEAAEGGNWRHSGSLWKWW